MLKPIYLMTFFNRIFIIICLTSLLSCEGNKEKVYYANGQLEYEVSIENGLREGRLTKYYEDGTVKGWSNWKQGQLNGESLFLFKNGQIEQKHNYIDGVRCCKSEFFSEDGALIEVQYLNENGTLIDYIKYGADGKQKRDVSSKKAIVIVESDTISYGESFNAIIRLGNREFDRIEVFLGDPNDKYILKNPKLSKIDSITAKLNYKDYEVGENTVTGVVVELDKSEGKKELVLVPFEYTFFVKGLASS